MTDSDFTMPSGDTKIIEVTVTDSAGEAVDLTGSSIRWQMSAKVTTEALVSKAIASGIDIVSAEDGSFTITIDTEDTEDLTGRFYHEAEVIDASGSVSTVLKGYVTITPTLIKTP